MSAANSSYDLDALHRAQRAYEPSMEEILASIRNIISEDRPGPTSAAPASSAPPTAGFSEPAPSAPAVEPQQTTAERADPPAIPRVVWPRPEVESVQKAVFVPPVTASAPSSEHVPSEPSQEADAPVDHEPLVSAAAQAAIANSFEALSVGVAVQNSTMIEDAVREMIRPMLKAWLDDNLPSIVESLVRGEIQRVARGAR